MLAFKTQKQMLKFISSWFKINLQYIGNFKSSFLLYCFYKERFLFTDIMRIMKIKIVQTVLRDQAVSFWRCIIIKPWAVFKSQNVLLL